jgi:predicted amino acid dehydrogenase
LKELKQFTGPKIEGSIIVAEEIARTIARKRFPSGVTFINMPQEEREEQATQDNEANRREEIAAAKVTDEIVVSAQHHSAINNAKVWLSPYHLSLMKMLVDDGYKVELLSENNEVVRVLEGKKS